MWPFRNNKNKRSKALTEEDIIRLSIREKLKSYKQQDAPSKFMGPPCSAESHYEFKVVDIGEFAVSDEG